jgi:pimeloyl-ACP methyl ester carboxylesterase
VVLLDNALKQRNVEGPVVLVAHSLGGQYALRYAKLRPNSVAALVLLDARMKDYTARCSKVASSCTPPPIAADTAKHLAAEVRGMQTLESGMPEPEELRSIPVTVIVRTKGPQPQLSVWQESQSDFARKLNNGKLVLAPDSGHFIQKDQLGLVAAEIVAAVELVY